MAKNEKFKKPVPIKIEKFNRFAGFAVQNVEKEHYFWAQTRGFITSDNQDFFTFINIIQSYFAQAQINENYVSNFIILHHSDLSVDVYINNLPIAIEMLSKRNVEAGEFVALNDVADLRRLRFPNIQILPTDHIFIGLKVGWRFLFHFDMTHNDQAKDYKIDTDKLYLELGTNYRQLLFYDVYQVIKSKPYYEQMQKDGWFSYVELLYDEFNGLAKTYENNFNYEDTVNKLLNSFNKDRIQRIVARWWNNPLYKSKQKILEAGINSFLLNTEEGYINCIKNLYTEIEGILRSYKYAEKKDRSGSTKKLAENLQESAIKRMGSSDGTLFPTYFTEYLSMYFYPEFKMNDLEFELTRHTISHGLASAESYTKLRALQVILVLDQIFFYIPPTKKSTKE
jgi:hypothetical protein